MTIRKYHHKIVRDLTPLTIEANGDRCEIRKPADNQERTKLLIDKLVEEAHELQAEFERTGCISAAELADVSDVRMRIEGSLDEASLLRYNTIRRTKNETRGGFLDDVILVWTEETNSGQCVKCFKGTNHKDPFTLAWCCSECTTK